MTGQLSETGVKFLEGRGLDIELALRLGLFSESTSGGGEVLAFPFHRAGVAINHKRRLLPKQKMWQDTGAPKAAWNEDALRDDSLLSQPLIITEGELDAMAAIQCGFHRTISVPDGAPPVAAAERDQADVAAKYAWLDPVGPLLHRDRVPTIIIASDGDAPGGQLLHDLSIRLGRARCKRVIYPKARKPEERGRERLKDLNEVLQEYGAKGVRAVIDQASFLQIDGIYRMSELADPPAIPTWDLSSEFSLLRENLRFRPGDVSVCSGIPSYGKTTMCNALWGDLICGHGLRVAWASFEQRTKPDHQRNLRKWFSRGSMGMTAKADQWIEDHHRFIIPPESEDATLERILDLAMTAVIRDGINTLVIDPWNELEHVRDRHVSLTEHVSTSLREVRRFARSANIHVQVLAHPTKGVQGQDGVYRRPRMYDISDSAAWYNKADLGFIVHRPNEEETQIVVEKSRYHDDLGKPGEVFMHFSRESGHYVEIGRATLAADAEDTQSKWRK